MPQMPAQCPWRRRWNCWQPERTGPKPEDLLFAAHAPRALKLCITASHISKYPSHQPSLDQAQSWADVDMLMYKLQVICCGSEAFTSSLSPYHCNECNWTIQAEKAAMCSLLSSCT